MTHPNAKTPNAPLALPSRGRVVLTPRVIARVHELRRQQISEDDIARMISEDGTAGRRGISKGSVHRALQMVDPTARRLLAVSPATVRAWLAEPPVDADTAEANAAAWRARHPELAKVDGFDVAEAMLEGDGGTVLYLLATPAALAGLAMAISATPYAFDETDGTPAVVERAVTTTMEGDRARATALLEGALAIVRGLRLHRTPAEGGLDV